MNRLCSQHNFLLSLSKSNMDRCSVLRGHLNRTAEQDGEPLVGYISDSSKHLPCSPLKMTRGTKVSPGIPSSERASAFDIDTHEYARKGTSMISGRTHHPQYIVLPKTLSGKSMHFHRSVFLNSCCFKPSLVTQGLTSTVSCPFPCAPAGFSPYEFLTFAHCRAWHDPVLYRVEEGGP